METWTLDNSGLEIELTNAIHCFAEVLKKENIITKEQLEKILKEKVIVLRKRSTISKIWAKIAGKIENENYTMFVANLID
jgi:arginine repressor